MVAKVSSVAVVGMEARPVEVEVALTGGVPDFHIVGLPSATVREARRRVESAIRSASEAWPQRRITASLAPGDLRKDGSLLDLAIAVAVLIASGDVATGRVSEYVLVGELALDGRVRPIRGALPAALAARDRGAAGLVVPLENAGEAALVPGIQVVGVSHLVEALAFLSGQLTPMAPPPCAEALLARGLEACPDLSEVRGQALARRALEIAAAGAHNVFLVGPPGAGKTMLARSLPGILPPLSLEEALEVTRVWSVAGLLPPGEAMVSARPFRAPHHHASAAAVIGGGSPVGPGEISLANRGILFLDEMPLFSRAVLEGLRQPVEDGVVTIARRSGTVRFPAHICLVGAANPCLCGRSGEQRGGCVCSPARLASYRSRLSGPLLDRIDLHVDVARLTESELMEMEPSEPSSAVRARVTAARERRRAREAAIRGQQDGQQQQDGEQPAGEQPAGEPPGHQPAGERFRGGAARLRPEGPRLLAELDGPARDVLRGALVREPLSARGLDRILRVARTIADLEGAARIEQPHLAEALQFRRVVWEP